MIPNNALRKSIAFNIFNRNDLGGLSKKKAEQNIIYCEDYKDAISDPLTAAIVKYVNSAEDMEELERNFDYAIGQLKKAKEDAMYGKLRLESQPA